MYTLVVSMGLLFTCIVIDCRVCFKCLTCCCLMSSQIITNVFRLQYSLSCPFIIHDIIGFATRVTRLVQLVEHAQFALSDHLNKPPMLGEFVLLSRVMSYEDFWSLFYFSSSIFNGNSSNLYMLDYYNMHTVMVA